MISDYEIRYAVMIYLKDNWYVYHQYKKKSKAQKAHKRLKQRYRHRFSIQKIKWRETTDETITVSNEEWADA